MNLADVRLLVTDIDGVMTDDTFEYSDGGQKRLRFNNADGQGILRLREQCGIETVFLTQEPNPDIERRAKALGCTLLVGGWHKLAALRVYLLPRWIPLSHVAYIGNDENDREVLDAVGFPLVPAKAQLWFALDKRVREWELVHREGGHGCVREVCEMILASSKRLPVAQKTLDRTQTL